MIQRKALGGWRKREPEVIKEIRVDSESIRGHLTDFELDAKVRYRGHDGVNHIFSLVGRDGERLLVYASDVYRVVEEADAVDVG